MSYCKKGETVYWKSGKIKEFEVCKNETDKDKIIISIRHYSSNGSHSFILSKAEAEEMARSILRSM